MRAKLAFRDLHSFVRGLTRKENSLGFIELDDIASLKKVY